MVDLHANQEAPTVDLWGFFTSFARSKGALSTLTICVAIAASVGCTVGIVAEVLTDRFARLHHHYDGDEPCWTYDNSRMPTPCMLGADEAQGASAWSTLALNTLGLFFNPVFGRLSDKHGRRPFLIIATFLSTLAPAALFAMQVFPTMSPYWYYIGSSLAGTISFLSLVFAALSDIVPSEFRAPSFALTMAALYCGLTLSPSLPLVMSHLHVSLLALVLVGSTFLYTVLAFPETLPHPEEDTSGAEEEGIAEPEQAECTTVDVKTCSGPFKDVLIINRNPTIRLLAIGSLFGAMAYSADASLLVFYMEDHLDVRANDIAHMFLLMGVVGIIMQVFVLQPLVNLLGEKGLLVLSFISGTIHNTLYGLARNKQSIYAGLCLSQLTRTGYPVLSSLASHSASENEQGQIQGAMFAVNAVGAAIGPLALQFIYDRTKDTIGAGTMFCCSALLYLIGTVAICFIPGDKHSDTSPGDTLDDLAEPLLEQSDSCNLDSQPQSQSEDSSAIA